MTNPEKLLRKKEWDDRFRRDVNGMASVGWEVVKEDKDTIIYQSRHVDYELQILFPDDIDVLNSLGKITQIDFEHGKIRVFVEKWKDRKKEQ